MKAAQVPASMRKPAPAGLFATARPVIRRGVKHFVLPLLLSCLATMAHAQVSPVRVQVEQSGKTDTTGYKTVQSRSLNITVSNSSAEPVNVKVKYAIFARDIKSQEIYTLLQGDMPATVKPRGSEKVQSMTANTAAEEARIGSKGKSEASDTRSSATGYRCSTGRPSRRNTTSRRASRNPSAKPRPRRRSRRKRSSLILATFRPPGTGPRSRCCAPRRSHSCSRSSSRRYSAERCS